MRNFCAILGVFVFLVTIQSSAIAAVSANIMPGTKGKLLFVNVGNNINKEDAAMLMRVAADMERKNSGDWKILAKLNSGGGSVRAALQIGRLLRKVGAMAAVDGDAVCFSSCVYILAGAVNRAVDGAVGIHRPYEEEGKEQSASVQKEKYKRLGDEIKSFLAEVNIPTKLYDDQLYISPENVKILTFSEMQAYGLNQNDPFAEEAGAAREAKELGITRAALADRKSNANRQCPWNGDNSKDTIMALLECRRAIVKASK